jgi:hypothetical protein
MQKITNAQRTHIPCIIQDGDPILTWRAAVAKLHPKQLIIEVLARAN